METNEKRENKQLHLGAGVEKKEMSPFFEALERTLSGIENTVNRASEILLLQHRNDKKYLETLSRIDFEYVTFLLKKLLKRVVQVETSFQPEDFYLDRKSIFYNKDIDHLGGASVERNILEVNFNEMVKLGGKEFSQDERYILVELVSTIIHEAIHLLAKKEEGKKVTTGFLVDKKQNESLNEAMTEILARAVTRSYFDFKKDFKGELMSADSYEDERKRLFALMVHIANDTQVSLDAVIQSFAVSYFHGDDVLNSLLELGEIGPEARALIDKLKKPIPKSKKDYIPFKDGELGNKQEVKDVFFAMFNDSPAKVVAKALKL